MTQKWQIILVIALLLSLAGNVFQWGIKTPDNSQALKASERRSDSLQAVATLYADSLRSAIVGAAIHQEREDSAKGKLSVITKGFEVERNRIIGLGVDSSIAFATQTWLKN